ncbi:hypothetical protein KHQ06_03240 [Nocardia tengchongensis]|uniref:Uncharacterized protein n=1 Tax=Nocardia tengchongensis TaxID=2055889 RepID=A0ABX8CQG1_9NOCA|nr:hypothetical protein [Nocardia tengchongensis]QVI22161.1 hypothetical protein KHQ06_03240 [Nocardia tengchongensis]
MRTPWSPQRAAPVSDSCAMVPERFTEDLAHSILLIHRSCPTDQCARRKAAVFFLYEQRMTALPRRRRAR